MKRRSFLKTSSLTALLPWTLNGLGARAFGQEASAFLGALGTTGRRQRPRAGGDPSSTAATTG